MIALVLYLLAAFGFAFVVGHSKISLPLREALANNARGFRLWLVALLECPGCLGWWTGAAVGWFWAGAVMSVAAPISLAQIGCSVLLAFATAASNLLLAKYVGMV